MARATDATCERSPRVFLNGGGARTPCIDSAAQPARGRATVATSDRSSVASSHGGGARTPCRQRALLTPRHVRRPRSSSRSPRANLIRGKCSPARASTPRHLPRYPAASDPLRSNLIGEDLARLEWTACAFPAAARGMKQSRTRSSRKNMSGWFCRRASTLHGSARRGRAHPTARAVSAKLPCGRWPTALPVLVRNLPATRGVCWLPTKPLRRSPSCGWRASPAARRSTPFTSERSASRSDWSSTASPDRSADGREAQTCVIHWRTIA